MSGISIEMSLILNSHNMVSKYIKIYLLSLLIFFSCRMSIFIMNNDSSLINYFSLLTSFYIGLKFDLVILGYISLIPILILFVMNENNFKSLNNFIFIVYGILCALSYVVSIADIFYFGMYKSHINIAAFHWIDKPKFVLDLLIQDKVYILSLIFLIILLGVYTFYFFKLFKAKFSYFNINPLVKILILLAILLSIRGRLDLKSPIRIGTAYFSNNSLFNELGLNANFVLIRSILDRNHLKKSDFNLIEQNAMNKVLENEKNYEAFKYCSTYSNTLPIESKKNIVLILMESMGTSCLSSPTVPNTTPFLDSLKKKSIYFNNFYSSGIHTFNGIFSTLYSIPSFSTFHSLKLINKKLKSIPVDLQNYGYYNIYFTTHDGQFDNVEGFLYKNGFNEVVSDDNYPISELKTNLGVSDGYMLNYSIQKLNKIQTPFFCTIMTSSNHTPFYTPPTFKRKFKDDRLNSISYSDFALNEFFMNAKLQAWYKNTIFVLVADHGINDNDNFPVSLKYNEIPLYIFDPNNKNVENFINSNIGSQIDVLPTLLEFIGMKCFNSNFGTNINCNSKEYVVYNYDNKYVVISKDHIFIEAFDKSFSSLYDRFSKAIVENKNIEDKMKEYGRSIMQLSNFYVNDGDINFK